MVQPTMTHHQAVATDMIPIITTLPDRRDMEMILRHLLIPQGMQHTICNKNYRGFHIKLNSSDTHEIRAVRLSRQQNRHHEQLDN